MLVHGGLVTASSWRGVVAELPSLECVCFERPGYGGAEPPGGSPYSYAAEASMVASLLSSPRWLAGYSSGGIVALLAALSSGVDRLALYEPPLPVHGPLLGEHLAEAQALVAAGDVAGAVKVGLVHGVDVPEFVADAMVGEPAMVRHGAAWVRELAEIDRLPPGVEQYRSVECPVLLLYGADTQRHHREAVDALAGVLPDCEVVRLDGEGHLAPLTSPARVAAELARFFVGQ